MDIFINFNTVYYEEGGLVLDRSKIVWHYISYQFVIDFTSVAFLIISIQEGFSDYLDLVFLIRLNQIGEILGILEEHWQLNQKFPTIWTLSNLMFSIVFLAHFCGCGFHLIAVNSHEETWLTAKDLDDKPNNVKYLYSLYFSFITMITVGYGDIIPISQNEVIYVILMTFISSGVFAYSVNTVGQIFQEKAQKEAKFKIQKQEINNYMAKRTISASLQIQVRKYLDYMQIKEDQNPDKATEILNSLSKNLRETVYKDFFGRIMSEIKIFKFNFSQEVIEELALYMNEVLYGPTEVIFTNGDIDERFFFIFKGQVELFIDKPSINKQNPESIIFDNKLKGEIFGETNLFTGQERSYSARSANVSHLIYIKRSDFISVMKQYPKDFEKFCEIKDQILLQYSKGNVRCYCCQVQGQQSQKYGHTIIDCPFMHFVKNKTFQIWRLNYSINQKRDENNKRNLFRSSSPLKNFDSNKIGLKKIRSKMTKLVNLIKQRKIERNLIENISDDSEFEEIEEVDMNFYLKQPYKFLIDNDNDAYLEVDTDNTDQSGDEDQNEQLQLEEFSQASSNLNNRSDSDISSGESKKTVSPLMKSRIMDIPNIINIIEPKDSVKGGDKEDSDARSIKLLDKNKFIEDNVQDSNEFNKQAIIIKQQKEKLKKLGLHIDLNIKRQSIKNNQNQLNLHDSIIDTDNQYNFPQTPLNNEKQSHLKIQLPQLQSSEVYNFPNTPLNNEKQSHLKIQPPQLQSSEVYNFPNTPLDNEKQLHLNIQQPQLQCNEVYNFPNTPLNNEKQSHLNIQPPQLQISEEIPASPLMKPQENVNQTNRKKQSVEFQLKDIPIQKKQSIEFQLKDFQSKPKVKDNKNWQINKKRGSIVEQNVFNFNKKRGSIIEIQGVKKRNSILNPINFESLRKQRQSILKGPSQFTLNVPQNNLLGTNLNSKQLRPYVALSQKSNNQLSNSRMENSRTYVNSYNNLISGPPQHNAKNVLAIKDATVTRHTMPQDIENIIQQLGQIHQRFNPSQTPLQHSDTKFIKNELDHLNDIQNLQLYNYDFDLVKCYQNYFPSGNYNFVVDKIKISRRLREMEVKKNIKRVFRKSKIKKSVFYKDFNPEQQARFQNEYKKNLGDQNEERSVIQSIRGSILSQSQNPGSDSDDKIKVSTKQKQKERDLRDFQKKNSVKINKVLSSSRLLEAGQQIQNNDLKPIIIHEPSTSNQ